MKKFYDFIKKGEFRVAVCENCSKKIWPPSEYCCDCFFATSLEKIETAGTLIECTSYNIDDSEELYGVVDIQGIKLIGSFSTNITPGTPVRMVDCGIRENGSPFYHFEPCKE
ncbi:MAG TPA: hypothetical protein VFI73_12605 [Candidatus Nitrosopolaris sp.]|nr:hypothetical protein [Candidatus Nitrosopolaris sp.]